jgi:glyoxylase-like metal-dependent hydrolase (beta-lactamase superfamily II)
MSLNIHNIKLGINRIYIIRDQGTIMVDAGQPGVVGRFIKKLNKHGIDPGDIRLMVLTHGDFDHMGSTREIKEVTGAKVAIHDADRLNLEQSLFNWPPGTNRWGKASRAAFMPLMKKMKIPAVKADITLGSGDFSLKDYGIKGNIVHTPGHTNGSVSVLLDTGEAFVGCLAHNMIPFRARPNLPIYGVDIDLIRESWRQIIDRGARMIYPGHGQPFPVEKILKYI